MASRYRLAHTRMRERQMVSSSSEPNHPANEDIWFPLTVVRPIGEYVTFPTITYIPQNGEFPDRYPVDQADPVDQGDIYAEDIQRMRWKRYAQLQQLHPPLSPEEKTPEELRRLLRRWPNLAEDSREHLVLCTQFHLDDTVLHPFAANRERANERLQSMEVGSYLVRPSSVGDAFTEEQLPFARVRVVSIRASSEEVRHLLIAHIFGFGWVSFTGDMVELRTHGFPSLGSERGVRILCMFPSAVELMAWMAEQYQFDMSAFVCS